MIASLVVVVNQFGLVSLAAGSGRDPLGPLPQRLKLAMLGAVFGLGCCLAMLSPLELEQGVFFDLRNLLIGPGAALSGPLPGLPTQGVEAGLTSMAAAFLAGLLWRLAPAAKPRPDRSAIPAPVVLGAVISASMLAGALQAPDFVIRGTLRGFVGWLVLGAWWARCSSAR